jgi:hypothetical protein
VDILSTEEFGMKIFNRLRIMIAVRLSLKSNMCILGRLGRFRRGWDGETTRKVTNSSEHGSRENVRLRGSV